MPTFEDPVADAAEVKQALRGLAHGTRSVGDPADAYQVLGSLALGLASLEQSLTQLADFYAGARDRASLNGDTTAGRAASQRVAEQLRHAHQLFADAAEVLDSAHNFDSEITYAPEPARVAHPARHALDPPRLPQSAPDDGLAL